MTERRRTEIREKDIEGAKYVKVFEPLLRTLRSKAESASVSPNRKLHFDHYAGLLLLYYYSPILTSLRSIQRATKLKNVQKMLGCSQAALGCLSEASHVFDPQVLREIIVELSGQLDPKALPGDPLRKLEGLTAVDGTILRGFPRMVWALWLGDNGYGAKAHVAFDVLRGAAVDATLTRGNGSERAEFRQMLQPGRLYVLDAGYAEYSLFGEVVDAGSSVICRIRDDASWKVIEERPVGEEAKAAGVQRDLVVELGSDKTRLARPMRVVEIVPTDNGKGRNRERILLATDRLDLDADLVGLAYRYRWSVELFFRWFKCILGCRRLLSENENGLTIQVYMGIIASLLISLWTGSKPTKATLEMIWFYLAGIADESEFLAHVDELKKHEHP